MIHLQDTNAFSYLMREDPRMLERVLQLPSDDQLVTCSIVRGKILYGIDRLPSGKRRRDLASKASHLFAALRCMPVPEEAGDHYAKVKITRFQKGLSMDENDLWIAATA